MARDVEFAVTASDKTGNALASAERQFKESQDRIRKESKKSGDQIGDDLKRGADKGSKGMLQTMLPGFRGLGLQGGQAIAAGIGVASPFIGSVLSAAVIGGAGFGGLVGGALLAARDPRVKAAGTELSKNLLGKLEQDAAPFVEPMLRNITKINIAFNGMNAKIKNIFANSANFMDPVVDGALEGVQGIIGGFDKLISRAQPVMEALGKAEARLGQATGQAMKTISGGSEEAAGAVDDLSRSLSATIQGVGWLVRGLTELYGRITFLPRKFGEWERSLIGLHDQAAATTATTSVLAAVQKTMGTVILTAGEAAGNAGMHMYTYSQSMADAADKGRGLYDSQTQVAEGVANAKAALEENGKTLDINSAKGRANRNVLSSLAGGLIANYQAFVKVNGEGAAAAGVAQRNRDKFIELAGAFTGSKKKAEALADAMGLIKPKNVSVHVNTHDAEARARALAAKLDAAARNRTANVQVVINTGRLASIENRLNRLGGSLYNAAGPQWAAVDGGSGLARTGGPTPVNVANNITVALDGSPFWAMTVQATRERSQRDAWRARTGRRQ